VSLTVYDTLSWGIHMCDKECVGHSERERFSNMLTVAGVDFSHGVSRTLHRAFTCVMQRVSDTVRKRFSASDRDSNKDSDRDSNRDSDTGSNRDSDRDSDTDSTLSHFLCS